MWLKVVRTKTWPTWLNKLREGERGLLASVESFFLSLFRVCVVK